MLLSESVSGRYDSADENLQPLYSQVNKIRDEILNSGLFLEDIKRLIRYGLNSRFNPTTLSKN